jgi:CSLREA domain-containing protein
MFSAMTVRTVATVLFLAISLSPLAAQPVLATIDGIHVNTSADTDVVDGKCSLREAIISWNVHNGFGHNECPDASPIYIDVATVNVTSQLPDVSRGVTFTSNLGGPRAEIYGPGTGTALNLAYTADGTIISGIKIDHFAIGIHSSGADVTITSNVIGPNSSYGVEIDSATATIGGSNSASPNPCSGACNVISGNTSMGIYWASSGGSIKGNFIGVDTTGAAASANGVGIVISSGSVTIGGPTAAERNVVSGNANEGIFANSCTCSIQGNYIGVNAAGNAAVANGGSGIASQYSQTTIGGTSAGEGNLISGNAGDGIFAKNSASSYFVKVWGNKIGVAASGSALGNSGNGIQFANGTSSAVQGAIVGDTGSGGNTIAYNSGAGVFMDSSSVRWNSVRGNSIHDNGGLGILLSNNANESIAAPVIAGTNNVHGTACNSCHIDVFSDSANEGRVFEGTVDADGSGNWTFFGSVDGPNVTATATNASGDTSQFSAPFAIPIKKPDGRIRKGHGSFIGNNIYNLTALNQTKTGSAAKGSTITFGISIQNDAATADKFKVVPTGANTTGYTIKYFHGTTDITAAVVAGTFQTPSLGATGKYLIKAKVTIGSTAATGSSVTRLVTITSVGDGSKQDAVKFIAKRS